MITGEQAKAARVLLNWSQRTLAEAAGYDLQTIIDFEGERRALLPEGCTVIQSALESAGVKFPEGELPRFQSAP